MNFQVEAYSWGRALIDPVIKRVNAASIWEADQASTASWDETKTFHTRIIARDSEGAVFKLYRMRTRPSLERPMLHMFTKTGSDGEATSQNESVRLNVLKSVNFPGEIIDSAISINAEVLSWSLDSEEIGRSNIKDLVRTSDAGHIGNFDALNSFAAEGLSDVSAMMGFKDDCWYYLSEVRVDGGIASFDFSMMQEDKDFVH